MRTRAPVGVRWPTAVVAIAASLYLAWQQWPEVAYFASSTEPISLGSEGDYHFERLASGRYAEVHGIPTLRGAYSDERGGTFVMVGLRDTPLVVRRATLPSERWSPGTAPPPPDAHPFAIRGRLQSQDAASRYADGFAKLLAWGEVRPWEGRLWLLTEADRPRANVGGVLVFSVLAAFAALNAVFLIRAFGRGRP